jgi:hypothetical protein
VRALLRMSPPMHGLQMPRAVLPRSPVQSLFLGTLPMGLCTIINAVSLTPHTPLATTAQNGSHHMCACAAQTVLLVCPHTGHWAVRLVWALWWIDIVLTAVIVFGMACESSCMQGSGHTE